MLFTEAHMKATHCIVCKSNQSPQPDIDGPLPKDKGGCQSTP